MPPPPAYAFETYGELQPWADREWLLTNGTGSFAMGTVVGCNARRYHGLLVAATQPPLGRVLGLARVAESVGLGEQASPAELSVNRFGELVVPRGDRYLRRFELWDAARWEYDADGARVTKELILLWGRPVAALRYTVDPGPHARVALRLQPFVALRDFHALLTREQGKVFGIEAAEGRCAVTLREHKLTIRCSAGRFEERPDWWYGHTYPMETRRGMEDREDLFTPGAFHVDVTGPTAFVLAAGVNDEADAIDFDAELQKRRAALTPPRPMPTAAQQRLARAAGDFVAKRTHGGQRLATVLAGFPWFGDWGRDALISLPGLLLATRRFQQAGQVLSVFAQHLSEGMVPNLFDDYTNEPEYNTADASLWFVHAAHAYLRASRDQETFDGVLAPACREIVDGYRHGTRFGIRMDDRDALVRAGDATTQLTWMDAKRGDEAFTPRGGKAVELNALWYNALCLVGEAELAARAKKGFVEAFWQGPYKGLADVISDAGERDATVRPNQIFAVSLPHSPLDDEQQRATVEVVRRELLTPFGLRTLAPGSPGYAPHYRGDAYQRDKAYHNGTVWPWLTGAFLDAYLRVNKRSDAAQAQARVWLRPLVDALEAHGCVGQLSECYDAEPPHLPVAAPAQAWSVAEVLRLAVELEM